MIKIAAGAVVLLAACGKDHKSDEPQQPKPEYEVYVAGSYRLDRGHFVGCYWKDGELFTLPTPVDVTTETIGVDNGSVYVTGWYSDEEGERVYGYWKDGNFVELDVDPQRNSIVVSAFSDGSVYFGGMGYSGDVVKLCYWKDGVQTFFPEPTESDCAIDEIAVSGGEVYMAGTYYTANSAFVCYWDDGKLITLGEPGRQQETWASGIALS